MGSFKRFILYVNVLSSMTALFGHGQLFKKTNNKRKQEMLNGNGLEILRSEEDVLCHFHLYLLLVRLQRLLMPNNKNQSNNVSQCSS